MAILCHIDVDWHIKSTYHRHLPVCSAQLVVRGGTNGCFQIDIQQTVERTKHTKTPSTRRSLTPSFFKLTMVSCGSKGWILTQLTLQTPTPKLLNSVCLPIEHWKSFRSQVSLLIWQNDTRFVTRASADQAKVVDDELQGTPYVPDRPRKSKRPMSAVSTSGKTYRQGLSSLHRIYIMWVHHFLIVWMECTHVYNDADTCKFHKLSSAKTRNVVPM